MDEFIGNKVDANGNLTREYRTWILGKKNAAELSRQAREEGAPRDLTKEEHDKLISSGLSIEDQGAISKEVRGVKTPSVEEPQLPVVERKQEVPSVSTPRKSDIPEVPPQLGKAQEIPLSETPTQKYYNEDSSKPWEKDPVVKMPLAETFPEDTPKVEVTQDRWEDRLAEVAKKEEGPSWMDKITSIVEKLGDSNNPTAMRLMDAIVKAGGALGNISGGSKAKYEESQPKFYETSKAIQGDQLAADKREADKAKAEADKAQLDRKNLLEDRANVLKESELQRKLDETNSKMDPASPRNNAMRNALLNVRPDLKGRLDGLGYDDMIKIYDNLNDLDKQKASEAYKNETLETRRQIAEMNNEVRRNGQELSAIRAAESTSLSRERLDTASTNKDYSNIDKLQKDYNTDPIVKGNRDLVDKADKVLSSPANNPAEQITLIFGFMKALDPTSVVREGEFATAQNAAGVPDRIVNFYNKLVNGEFLTQDQINEVKAIIKRQREEAVKSIQRENENFKQRMINNGIDESRFVYHYPASSQPQGQTPQSDRVRVSKDGKVGTIPRSQLESAIQNGYKLEE